MKIVLHIGMPKCGSSALQHYLSSNEFLAFGAVGRVCYAAITSDGLVVNGAKILDLSRLSPHQYITSCDGFTLANFNKKKSADVVKQLKSLGREFDVVILSNEGWGPHPNSMGDNIFSDSLFDVQVVSYIRPQIDWFNSAWWQWGAWTGSPFRRWVFLNREKADWSSLHDLWRCKPWVRSVEVRLLTNNIVRDFIEFLGLDLPVINNYLNKSLPASVIRIFQKYRHLRPGPHDSANDFILAKHLGPNLAPPPWVMTHDLLKDLMHYYKSGNQSILHSLPPDQKVLMSGDPRWWDEEAYTGREVDPIRANKVGGVKLEQLTVLAIEAVIRLEFENIELKAKLHKALMGAVIPPSK